MIIPPLQPNHGAPKTRRQFLGQGVISFSGTLVAPSVLSLVTREAYGAACEAPKSSGMLPFICIDLGGGANLAGANVIVGGAGNQKDYLPSGSYGSLGLSPEIEPASVVVNEEFGLAFHPESRFLQGMVAATDPATRSRIDGGVFCTVSGDDTQNNPHNPMYWIAKAGLGGEVLSMIGTGDTLSGGRAMAPPSSINSQFAPAKVASSQDAIALVTSGRLGEILGTKGVQKVISATNAMSESALKRFYKQTYSSQLKDLVSCTYSNAEAQLAKYTREAVDPAQDNILSNIFNINNREENRAAAIAKLVLDGMAGGGTISLGGYDYHNNPRTNTDPRDLNAGNIVGKILEYAGQRKKDLMVYVFTDGGISCRPEASNQDADTGRFNPSSDSGSRSCAFAMVHRGEGGRPELAIPGRQIGGFTSNGGVDAKLNLISNSVENLSKSIVLNYLALHGREGEVADVVGDNPFQSDLGSYLMFKKMVG